jgi:hypothetical protein
MNWLKPLNLLLITLLTLGISIPATAQTGDVNNEAQRLVSSWWQQLNILNEAEYDVEVAVGSATQGVASSVIFDNFLNTTAPQLLLENGGLIELSVLGESRQYINSFTIIREQDKLSLLSSIATPDVDFLLPNPTDNPVEPIAQSAAVKTLENNNGQTFDPQPEIQKFLESKPENTQSLKMSAGTINLVKLEGLWNYPEFLAKSTITVDKTLTAAIETINSKLLKLKTTFRTGSPFFSVEFNSDMAITGIIVSDQVYPYTLSPNEKKV